MSINVQSVSMAGVIDMKRAAEQMSQSREQGEAFSREKRSLLIEEKDVASRRKVDELGETVASLQEFIQSIQRNLSFRVDDSSGRVVVEVREQASGDIIRQIPSEEALRLLKHLQEARSLMLNTSA